METTLTSNPDETDLHFSKSNGRNFKETGDEISIKKSQEKTRVNLANYIVMTFCAIALIAPIGVIIFFVAIECDTILNEDNEFFSAKIEATMQAFRVILELLISPLVGLVGGILGFYFAEKKSH